MQPRERFRVVPATALPLPHNPFRCRYAQRYIDLLRAECGLAEGRGWPPRVTRAEELAAGRRFDASLRLEELAACRYHRGDWRAAARAALSALRDVGDWNVWALSERLAGLGLDEVTERWAISLLTDPIYWAEGDLGITNGQHRACALRHSRAPAVPVLGH